MRNLIFVTYIEGVSTPPIRRGSKLIPIEELEAIVRKQSNKEPEIEAEEAKEQKRKSISSGSGSLELPGVKEDSEEPEMKKASSSNLDDEPEVRRRTLSQNEEALRRRGSKFLAPEELKNLDQTPQIVHLNRDTAKTHTNLDESF